MPVEDSSDLLMNMHPVQHLLIVLAPSALLVAPGAIHGQAHAMAPVATTTHFAFYSDFATNLNDALVAAGSARKFGNPELFHSGAEASCFERQRSSAQAAWNQAVDYYSQIISPAGFDDKRQYLLRAHLASFEHQSDDAMDVQFVGIATSFMAAARPAYEACRWTVQDAENRRWIEDLNVQLATHGQEVTHRLESLYRKSWDGLPVRADIVETVSWSGANTVFLDPVGGHLLISREYQGSEALEIVFHEASHLLMGRNDPLQRALAEAASNLDRTPPDGLWHVVLFYTTGETVRRVLHQAGEPDYTPMLNGIYQRSPWGRYRDAIDSAWPAYMDGKRTLAEAAGDLVEAISETATK